MSAVVYLPNLGDLYPDDDADLAEALDPKTIYWSKMHDDTNDRDIIYLAHAGGTGGKSPRHTVRWGSTHKHQVLSIDPPSLVESIGWQECCGRHGYVKDGVWTPTSDSLEP